MTGALARRGEVHAETQGRRSCEDGGGEWSFPATSQGMARMAGNHRKLGEKQVTVCFSKLPEKTNPADTLISDFRPPKL